MSSETLIVSVITVVFNNVASIRRSVESVLAQDYSNIEYIVVDGGSTDGTVDILKEYKNEISVFVSESDSGIYDALNKGISLSSGDIIAILHSDDQFFSNMIVSEKVARMSKTKAEICFSDLIIVNNQTDNVVRYYMAGYFKRWMLRIGWMPPHPTCFIRKSLFTEFGLYSTKYKIAGDFDFLVRIFYGKNVKWLYADMISVRMSEGGASNSGWESKKLIAREINSVLRNNNIWSLPILQLLRYVIRLLEMVIKPDLTK